MDDIRKVERDIKEKKELVHEEINELRTKLIDGKAEEIYADFVETAARGNSFKKFFNDDELFLVQCAISQLNREYDIGLKIERVTEEFIDFDSESWVVIDTYVKIVTKGFIRKKRVIRD